MISWSELVEQLGVSQYPVTQVFGVHAGQHGYGAMGHLGVDLGTPIGTPVKMPSGVKSVSAHVDGAANGGWGNYLKLIYSNDTEQILGHLSEFHGISPGETISGPAAGKVYALTGNSGNTTGPHLDISTKVGGRWTNPVGLHFPGRAGTGTAPPPVVPASLQPGGIKLPAPAPKKLGEPNALLPRAYQTSAAAVADNAQVVKQAVSDPVGTVEQAVAKTARESVLDTFRTPLVSTAGALLGVVLLALGVVLLGMSWGDSDSGGGEGVL